MEWNPPIDQKDSKADDKSTLRVINLVIFRCLPKTAVIAISQIGLFLLKSPIIFRQKAGYNLAHCFTQKKVIPFKYYS